MTNRSHQIKDKLFKIYSESSVLSGYSSTQAYYCPLCGIRFDNTTDLTLDHVPLQASDLPTVTVLTCDTCNNDSGPAQNQLLQRHLWLQLKRTGKPTAPRPCRLTLTGLTVNAAMSRDRNGEIVLDVRPKHNKPEEFERFREAYRKATGSNKIRMEPLVRLNEPSIRWALVREAYLLLFYHWGYWLLRKAWASEVRKLLSDPNALLPEGCYVSIPEIGYRVAATKGEFATAKTPSGQRCFLVPVIDNSWVVMPTDDPSHGSTALWKEMKETVASATERQPLREFKKVIVDRDVKSCSLWAVIEREDPIKTPEYWIEIVPGDKAREKEESYVAGELSKVGWLDRRFLGSTIAILLGILGILSALANPSNANIAGVEMTLGALAYRSAKKRRLGLTGPSASRRVAEIGALIAMVALVVFQTDVVRRMYEDPVPNVMIPLWVVIAYLVVQFVPPEKR